VSNSIKLLVIEDEEFDVRRIKNTIRHTKKSIEILDIVSSGKQALELLKKKKKNYDVIIMDFQISGGLKGEELINEIRKIDAIIQIVIVTKMTIQQTDYSFAYNLIKAGAFLCCTKYPGDIEEYIYQPTDFILAVVNAYQKKRLELERQKANAKIDRNIRELLDSREIIGKSESIGKLRIKIDKYAKTDANIVIYGQSGTGKELIASNIHYQSDRKYENFVPINCASLPSELIESELFGFEKGAFTGAHEKRTGYFELANKGTIFLDEVAEFPLSAQAKLLRVLQEGEIDKIGRNKSYKVDVRVIAATLQEHPEDIPVLIDHFLIKYSFDMGSVPPEMDEAAGKLLYNYPWPGNVRELQNVVQRIVLTCDSKIDEEIVIDALGGGMQSNDFADISRNFDKDNILPLREIEKIVRKKYIFFVRKHCKTDAEASKKLGLAAPNYHRICKELGLK